MKFIIKLLSATLIVAVLFAVFNYVDFAEIYDTAKQKLSQISPQNSEETAPTKTETHTVYNTPTAPTVLPYSQITDTTKSQDYGYCYAQMNERQQLYYRLMFSAFEDMYLDFFELSSSDTNCKNNINIAFNALLNDHPEIFWHNNTYEIRVTNNTEYSLKLGFSMQRDERDQKRQQLNAKIEEIINETHHLTDSEKELYFYNLLCNEVEYSFADNDIKYTAFGALCENMAVCEGYAKAMQLLCDAANIECLLVRGMVENNLHVWNLVNLCDGWYEVDLTFSDRDTAGINYLYFNATTEEISATHNRLNDINNIDVYADFSKLSYNFSLPNATATLYNRDTISELYEYAP